MPNQPLVSVIIPTYNESTSIRPLLMLLSEIVGHSLREIIVVDDSSQDGTDLIVNAFARENSRVVLVSRPSKLGLSSAIFEGSDLSQGDVICVMDADLSHDPEEIPTMLAKITDGFDIVIGSRYAPGGSIVNLPIRRWITSNVLNKITRTFFNLKQDDVLSGFVLCRRHVFDAMPTRYSYAGFKFLLELLVTGPNYKVYEIPITFRNRSSGKSKATYKEFIELLALCAQLVMWKFRTRVKHFYRVR